jgi:predicted dienelactone hydrolase
MGLRFLALVIAAFLLSHSAWSYEPAGPDLFETSLETWHDPVRNRDVPVKIFLPKTNGPHPIIIFSHGLGGSREGYSYLGEWWAGNGYVVVHPQHAGSDENVWKNAPLAERRQVLAKATTDLSNSLNRIGDVKFVIDELTRLQADSASPLRGRLDLDRIGLAGHSYGGWTTLAVVGRVPAFVRQSIGDPRVKAAIQMSAPALPGASYANVTIPVLHLTGTLDDSPIGETKAADRRKPFDAMSAAPTGLIIYDGADHMTFSGRTPLLSSPARDDRYEGSIKVVTTAFWNAWLKGDANEQKMFTDGWIKKLLGPTDVYEWKQPAISSASRAAD